MVRVLISLLLLCSCKATQHTYKKVATDLYVTSEKKAIIAPWVSANFQIQQRILKGEVDTFEVVMYDDELTDALNRMIDSLAAMPRDTVLKMLKENCKTITKIKYLTRVDTAYLADGSTIYQLQRSLALSESENVKANSLLQDQKEKVKRVSNHRNISFGINLFFLLSVIAFLYFKMKK